MVSRVRDSLVRSIVSDPCPPAAVQSVTAAIVKFGVSLNSIVCAAFPSPVAGLEACGSANTRAIASTFEVRSSCVAGLRVVGRLGADHPPARGR